MLIGFNWVSFSLERIGEIWATFRERWSNDGQTMVCVGESLVNVGER